MRRCATSPHLSPNPPSITRSEIKSPSFRFGHEIGLCPQRGQWHSIAIHLYVRRRKDCPLSARLHQVRPPKRERDKLYSSVELRHN